MWKVLRPTKWVGVMGILGSLIGPATQLLDKVIEDKDQKAALAHEIATMAERHAQELAKGQLKLRITASSYLGGDLVSVGCVR